MIFDIEHYLDSLPNDTTEINISHKDITYLPELTRFTKLHTLYCMNNKLTSFPSFNESLRILYITNNQLTTFNWLLIIYKLIRISYRIEISVIIKFCY